MKYLVLLAVLAIAYGMWRSKHRPPPPTPQSGRRPSSPAVQDMVACAHCGLHLPRTDALPQGGQFYCSADHRARGPR